MFQNITSNILGGSASVEILTMLLWAFVLGMLFSHCLRPRNIKISNSATNPVVAAAPVKSAAKSDDLQLIEWIWPALEKALQKNSVNTYQDILKLDISGLEQLLESLGWRYAKYNPTTWPDQADLAKRKKWSELEEYQEIMKSSKKKSS